MKLKDLIYLRKNRIISLIAIIPGIILPLGSFAQGVQNEADSIRAGALNLFIDCRTCDMNYTREQIPYVNYVRDTREAEVYLFVGSQPAGSGGQQYTFTYEGLGKFEGMNDTLNYTSNPDESSTVVREKKTNMMKMGLMRYVARTPLASEVIIRNSARVESEEVIDKWNYWVFELQTSPRYNAEESNKRLQFSNSINISRITPDMKFELEVDQNINKQTFYDDDGVATVYHRNSNRVDLLYVKSISEHWSTGLRLDMGSSTSNNYNFNTEFLPSIEYDIYPYSESTHRQFRILYSIGYQYSNYIDTTILNKTQEGLFKQELQMAYQVQKKWGSANVSLSGSNYFHDLSKNKIELDGYIRLRIIKGLSLSINGGVAYVNDQLNLRKGDLTEAERLLRLKEQATSYEIQGGLSITYTFGSIYNNVVNPRFGNGRRPGGGGGGGFF